MTALLLILTIIGGAYSAGSSTGKYLYDGNAQARNVVDVKSAPGDFVSSRNPRVLEFYSPYCGHCRSFAPKYIELADKMKKTHPNVEFHAISCAAHYDICQKYKIRGYPSVFTVQEGKKVSSEEDLETLSQSFLNTRKIAKALGLQDGATPLSERKLEDSRQVEEEEPSEENEEEEEQTQDSEERTQPPDSEEETQPPDSEEETQAPDSEEEEVEPFPQKEEEEEATESEDESKDPEDSFTEQIFEMPRNAGAETARHKERHMDRWKEDQRERLVEYKKRRWRKKHNSDNMPVVNPGATNVMKAHRKGTQEFRQRHEEVLQQLEKFNKRKMRRDPRAAERIRSGKPIIQKKLRKARLVEHIPGVKRLVRMTAEEELILDASVSFREGMVFIFKSEDPLNAEKKAAFRGWLELLAISIPPEWGLRETISYLLQDFDHITEHPKNLKMALKQRKFPRRHFSKSCKSGTFTCGFWKLLHIATIGVAEHRGGLNLVETGLLSSNARMFSPMEAADSIYGYMKHFFPCDDCSDHFVRQYEDCEMNRRCDRLVEDAVSARDEDWKELGMWLWEFHNTVSVRLLNEKSDEKRKSKQRSMFFKEKAGPGKANRQDEIKALWPTLDGCIVCYSEDGTFNEDAVFLHLEKTYWYVQLLVVCVFSSTDRKTDTVLTGPGTISKTLRDAWYSSRASRTAPWQPTLCSCYSA